MMDDSSTSTHVPSMLKEERVEKEETGSIMIIKDNEAKAETVHPPTQDASEYPKGTSLTFIVLALALSIFLASLDMVGDLSGR